MPLEFQYILFEDLSDAINNRLRVYETILAKTDKEHEKNLAIECAKMEQKNFAEKAEKSLKIAYGNIEVPQSVKEALAKQRRA